MTYPEYIRQLLEFIRNDGGAPGDLSRSLPMPDEGDGGMYAVWKLVCDPHFRSACKRDPIWYAKAQSMLEDLARSAVGLNCSALDELIKKCLENYLCRMLGTGGQRDRYEPDRPDKEPEMGPHLFGGDGGDGVVPRADQHEPADTDGLLLFERFGTVIDDLFPGRKMVVELPEEENAPLNVTDAGEDYDSGQGPEEEEEDESEEGERSDDASRGDKVAEEQRSLRDEIASLASESSDCESGVSIGHGTSRSEHRRRENRFLRSIPKELLRLAKLIGRTGSTGSQEGGYFPAASKSDITGITVGDNLNALLPSELALLSSPSTQDVFFRNYVGKRLQIFASASSGTVPVRHQDGPVIICLDTSGSMIGEKIDAACALAIAVTIIAQRRRRSVLVIKYSDWHFLMKITNIHNQVNDLVDFLSSYGGCGNNENELFRWLFDDILPSERAFDTADILCVTDFGWDVLTDETKDRIRSAKDGGLLFYGLNIMEDDCNYCGPANDYCDRMMLEVCDSLWCYRSGECWEDNA